METVNEMQLRRPAGADAARVLAAVILAGFHIWQQSWIGGGRLDAWNRTGYLWVDLFMILSGFCLALPYMADQVMARPFRGTAGFYRRRLLRILPEYWLCLAGHLLAALLLAGPSRQLLWDLLAHLSLTQTLFPQTYYFTRLGTALWSVSIMAGFYLLFPLLIRCFARHPWWTLGGLIAVQAGYTYWCFGLEDFSYQMAFNQLPAQIALFGVGMMTARIYSRLCPAVQGRAKPAFLAGAVLVLCLIHRPLNFLAAAQEEQRTQLAMRLPMSLPFAALLLLLCLGMGESKPGRPLAVLAGASYSFYLWHQSIAVWLKQARIPYWAGDTPPNMLGDRVWMSRYHILCWAVAAAVAFLAVFAVNRLTGLAKRARQQEKTAV